MSTDADGKVERYILAELGRTASNSTEQHLAACSDTIVVDADASEGSYGCDTGCSYYRLTARIECSHDLSVEFEYGDFGEIADILEDLA